ncbi:MAG: hypothetical protein HFJ72_08965 [Adlercreutzia sp.]|nr:hypothetical protein [Adlercreutzia sp.]
MRKRALIFVGALAAVFTIVAFAVPFERNEGFWVAYLFGIVALAAQLYLFPSAFKGGGSAKSRVYGFPIARIGVFYLAVQLCISVVEMACSSIMPFWAILIVNAIVLVLALAGCISTEAARSEVVKIEASSADSVSGMTDLRLTGQSLARTSSNGPFAAQTASIAEALRFSDPISSESTRPLENRISADLALLEGAIQSGDEARVNELAEAALRDIQQRNDICRAHKH